MREIFAFCLLLIANFCIAQEPKLMLPVGHKAAINTAVFSPDGKQILSSSDDSTAMLWDVSSEALLCVFKGFSSPVTSAFFSPDSRKILIVLEEGSVDVYDIRSQKNIFVLGNTDAPLKSAIFSPDADKILVTSDSGKALLYQLSDGVLLRTLSGHTGPITSAAFSLNGKKVLTASKDSTARIWNLENGEIYVLRGHSDAVYVSVFSFDGTKVLTAVNTTARIWDAESGHMETAWEAENGRFANEFNFSNGGSAYFSSNAGKVINFDFSRDTARIFNITTGSVLGTFESHIRDYSAVFSPDGTKILTNYGEVLDANSGKTLFILKPVIDSNYKADLEFIDFTMRGKGQFGLTSISFSGDGKYILTGSEDGVVRVWSSVTGVLLFALRGHTSTVNSAGFYSAHKFFTVSEDLKLRVWDLHLPKILFNIDDIDAAYFYPDKHKFLTLPSLAVTVGNDLLVNEIPDVFSVKMWDANTGALLLTLKPDSATVADGDISERVDYVDFSKDGKKVLTGSSRWGWVKIWDAHKGNKLLSIRNAGASGFFSPDGTKVIGDKYEPRVFDAKTGVESHQFDKMQSIIFSPDNKRMITIFKGVGQIRNSTTRALLFTLRPSNDIYTAVFSSDGKVIVTTSGYGEALVWDAQSGKLFCSLQESKGNEDREVEYSLLGSTMFFSKDGKRTIRFQNDRAKIWELKTGRLLKNQSIHSNVYDVFENKALTAKGSEITVFNLENGQPVLTAEAIDDNDYFISIPNHFYLCSQNSAKLLHYVTSDLKVITFEQLDLKYNRPDLVLQAIGSTDTALITSYKKAYIKRIKRLGFDTTQFVGLLNVPEADFTNRDEIEYEQKNNQLTLHISAHDSSYNLDRFNLWINEVPLFSTKGVSLKWRNKKDFDTTLTVSLSDSVNIIETSVTNVSGFESYRMPLQVNFKPEQKAKEKLFFVGIGVDKFADDKHNLQYSVKDIRNLAQSLKEKYGSNITVDTLFNEKVSVSSVRALKKKLQDLSSINDKVILSYSGHGLLSDSFDYYLSTYDVNFKKPEQGGLAYEELENLLDGIPPRKKLLLIDACHSGEIDKDEMKLYDQVKDSLKELKGVVLKPKDSARLGMKNSFELMQELFVDVGRSTGSTVISAASGTQFAQERGQLKNGVFTYSILEYMKDHLTATVSELKAYVNKRVPELTRGLQQPTSRSENRSIDWKVW